MSETKENYPETKSVPATALKSAQAGLYLILFKHDLNKGISLKNTHFLWIGRPSTAMTPLQADIVWSNEIMDTQKTFSQSTEKQTIPLSRRKVL